MPSKQKLKLRPFLNVPLQKNKNAAPDLLIDIGCGSGQNTSIFSLLVKKVVGLDVALDQLEQGRSRFKDLSNVEFRWEDFYLFNYK